VALRQATALSVRLALSLIARCRSGIRCPSPTRLIRKRANIRSFGQASWFPIRSLFIQRRLDNVERKFGDIPHVVPAWRPVGQLLRSTNCDVVRTKSTTNEPSAFLRRKESLHGWRSACTKAA
jgi:hypothetical protein